MTELLTYTDNQLSEGARCYYQVCAISSGVESALSNTALMQLGTDPLLHLTFDDLATPAVLGHALELDGNTEYMELIEGVVENFSDLR